MFLKGEGWPVNGKRIYRLNTQEGLTVQAKSRKRAATRRGVSPGVATAPKQQWSMDFVSDRFGAGRGFLTLTVVDQFTREGLLLLGDRAMSGEKVATALE